MNNDDYLGIQRVRQTATGQARRFRDQFREYEIRSQR